jgi:outer membrane protein OmpA-like peptidoglycan-associated protein
MRITSIFFLFIAIFTSANLWAQLDTVMLSEAPFNSEGNEFAVRNYQGALVFLSDAKDMNGNSMYDKKTGEPFTDLYMHKEGKTSLFEIPNAEGQMINASSLFFDGPFTATKNEEFLFFSNNLSKEMDKNKLGIFYTFKQNLGYASPLPFFFNSEDYNTTHPYFDDATNYLYFSSDQNTGIGGMDVYRVKFENNTFGEVEALSCNSQENDIFPTVNNGVLYFSSNRVGAQGGYDFYKFEKQIVQPLIQPFNSEYDDIALSWSSDSTGYFSTNRPYAGNLNAQSGSISFNDNTYAFEVRNVKSVVKIDLQLKDKDGQLLKDAVLTLNDGSTGNLIFKGTSDQYGRVVGVVDTLPLNITASYKMNINKQGVASSEKNFEINIKDRETKIDNSTVEMNIEMLTQEMEITELLGLSTIFYDFNSSVLRPESKKELNKVIQFMNLHPEVSVELGSHTDCKGSDAYNLWLAKRRAAVAGDYIKKQVSIPKNVVSLGYGEQKARVVCDCEDLFNACTDDQNQVNRRTEFKISAINFSTGK